MNLKTKVGKFNLTGSYETTLQQCVNEILSKTSSSELYERIMEYGITESEYVVMYDFDGKGYGSVGLWIGSTEEGEFYLELFEEENGDIFDTKTWYNVHDLNEDEVLNELYKQLEKSNTEFSKNFAA